MVRRGILWLVLGAAISIVSYSAAQPGQRYFVLIGPILVGTLLILEGLGRVIFGPERYRNLLVGCRNIAVVLLIVVVGAVLLVLVIAVAKPAQTLPPEGIQSKDTSARNSPGPTPTIPGYAPTSEVRTQIPTSTPSPVKMWVCADLAYGYARPDEKSEQVWQMSRNDGWSVFVYEKVGTWFAVIGTNKPVYMKESTLCANSPDTRKPLGPTPPLDPSVCSKPPGQMGLDEIYLCAQITPVTPSRPRIPPGLGGLIIVNYYGSAMNFTIGGELYQVPGNDRQAIFLPPGTHNYSANIPGLGKATGTIVIEEGKYAIESFALQ